MYNKNKHTCHISVRTSKISRQNHWLLMSSCVIQLLYKLPAVLWEVVTVQLDEPQTTCFRQDVELHSGVMYQWCFEWLPVCVCFIGTDRRGSWKASYWQEQEWSSGYQFVHDLGVLQIFRPKQCWILESDWSESVDFSLTASRFL